MQVSDFASGLGFAALSLFSALTALALVARSLRVKTRTGPGEVTLANIVDRSIFLFDGATLIDASPRALMFLGIPIANKTAWQTLIDKADSLSKDIVPRLQSLADQGIPFDVTTQHPDQTLRISGKPDAGFARIEIDQQAPQPENALGPHNAEMVQQNELALLRELADLAPVMAWMCDPSGKILWANRGYLDMLKLAQPESPTTEWPLPTLFADKPEPRPNHPKRKPLPLPNQPKPQWFEHSVAPLPTGGALHFALHADPVVRAEETLRNFVQTLTQTFAHLPIGLAIFDRGRQLALFNPALMDLTSLEPDWLTTRPTLSAFLDRLREKRHIPEPKNYKTWRDRIAALEREAVDGTYEENWPLPDGRTYRVIGRPHPEGAVAFLFEDITATLGLHRQFRSELELGQSVIDTVTDAIAVFSTGGELVMSNQAYAQIWGVDPGSMLARPDLSETFSLWQSQCLDAPKWLDDYTAINPKAGAPCDLAPLSHQSGRRFRVKAARLARGALIFQFSQQNTDVDLLKSTR